MKYSGNLPQGQASMRERWSQVNKYAPSGTHTKLKLRELRLLRRRIEAAEKKAKSKD